MSAPATPLRPGASAPPYGGGPDPNLRIGDAERTEVADRLAKHFGDGRLDEAEFSDRLDRALHAKTMTDLTGLLADLPDTEPAPPLSEGGSGRRHQRRMLKLQVERERERLKHERRAYRHAEHQQRLRALGWIPLAALLIVAVAIFVHTLTHSVGVWLLIGLVVFVWIRHRTT
jgi:hypothetical protein